MVCRIGCKILLSLLLLFSWQVDAQDYTIIRHELMVAMDDGVRLNTTVFEPIDQPPESGWPAIVFIHGLGGSKNVGSADAFSKGGYVTMAYTVRGQGQRTGGAPSEGMSTLLGPRESQDLKAMIAWLKENHAVDPGRIGIAGGSQGAIHTWMAVAQRLGIAAAVPQSFTADLADAVIMNGSIHSNLARALGKDFVDSTLAAEGRSLILTYGSDGLREKFARPRDLRSGLADVTTPVMIQFAWEDGWGTANGVIADFALLKGPKKLYLGTGGLGSARVRSEASFRSRWTQHWLDRWLKGDENGIEDGPPVEIALLDTWEHLQFSAFPPPESRDQTWFLQGTADTIGILTPDPPATDTAQILTHACDTTFTMQALYDANVPLRGADGVLARFTLDSLLYETPPLESDLLVVGIPKFSLFAESAASGYQINLRLWDIDPQTGTKRLFSRATYLVRKETHPDGDAVSADMGAIGYRIPAGHRIRLEISNLDLDWNTAKQEWRRLWGIPYFEQAKIRIHSGGEHPSRVVLPVLTAE